jgi:7,8-dihydropterin-6-yl-methyl-4-(beta-D-ribofuranosyl)aminobenzene 5'-phosphate synthase
MQYKRDTGEEMNSKKTTFTIVYDNELFQEDLLTGWGFSCFIETPSGNILFDTGWDGNVLIHNMNRLGIKPGSIQNLMLSHSHWDHIGGLTHILSLNPKLKVYAPTSFSRRLKSEIDERVDLVEVIKSIEINTNLKSTGELGEDIIEQSLLVNTNKGLIVVTGCSHPGLEVILKTAKLHGDIFGVIGGFHGFNKYDILSNLELIISCHCTEFKDKILNLYPKTSMKGGTGRRILI